MSEHYIETHGHGDAHIVLLHGWAMHGGVFARGTPDPGKLHEGLQVLAATDLRPRLPGLAQPSAWISGARDRLIPAQAMQWSATACGGTFTRIEHAGHAPFIGFADRVVAALTPLMHPATGRRKRA